MGRLSGLTTGQITGRSLLANDPSELRSCLDRRDKSRGCNPAPYLLMASTRAITRAHHHFGFFQRLTSPQPSRVGVLGQFQIHDE